MPMHSNICIHVHSYAHAQLPYEYVLNLLQDHLKEECQQFKISCPNDGCSEEITRLQLDDHLQQCQYRRVSCYWCKEQIYFDKQKVVKISITL